ncbi:MAG: mannosyl transferase [Leeuwenhoekiella sp.]|nr:MAG: mannosyl transferase [Leeuwenhoekiella sp.]
MRIVLFTHPAFLNSNSMPRYARMLEQGMQERGHEVAVCTARACFYKIPAPKFLKKWLGYLDQYVVFPLAFKLRRQAEPDLYVFADQALGPWVPLVKNMPHVIHCHDFLAQRAAEGAFPEQVVGTTGRWYQQFIRWGYRQGSCFICISEKTRQDLQVFLQHTPRISKVVYNGFNQQFNPGNPVEVRKDLGLTLNIDLSSGYILHVGGNQFYKNRLGVLELYEAYSAQNPDAAPLLLVGTAPNENLLAFQKTMDSRARVHFCTGFSDEQVRMAYQGALVLLYPSLEEGFGWPIAEAQASGCPVITTAAAPMNEVGGEAAWYIPRRKHQDQEEFITTGVARLEMLLDLNDRERLNLVEAGIQNAKRFNTPQTLDKITLIYKQIVSQKWSEKEKL